MQKGKQPKLIAPSGYQLPNKDVLIKKSSVPLLSDLDACVLDIDGVLINVKDSFRRAICKTIEVYFSRILKCAGTGTLLTVSDTDLFKQAGGFNDDWDLSCGAALYYADKIVRCSCFNLNRLSLFRKDLPHFTETVKNLGGGLKNAEQSIIFSLLASERKALYALWRKDLIVQIFKEIYAGERHIKKLYHSRARFLRVKGVFHKEKALLSVPLPAGFKYGIVTGRSWEETKVALQRLKLRHQIPDHHIVCQEHQMKKPDPASLRFLSDHLQPRVGLYVGDILDDLLLVKSFMMRNRKRGNPVFLSAIVVGKLCESSVRFFLPYEPDLLASDVNMVLTTVERLKNRELMNHNEPDPAASRRVFGRTS